MLQKFEMQTHAILGFMGRMPCNADNCIHFKVNDMQMAEDTQLIVGHIIMQCQLHKKTEEIDLVGQYKKSKRNYRKSKR